MLKIMTILGTRPELIKMSRVITQFDLHTKHLLVHTGQNYDYELNKIFFDDLDIRKPDYFLETAESTVAQTIARVIENVDEILAIEQPDAVMLYGDTNSCLAVIAAKRRKIPIFHMEAGNRCFDQRVPEEINRKIVDHLSDINLVITEHARHNLLAEGIKPDSIIKTGSHMCEVLDFYLPKIMQSEILVELNLTKSSYFIVSAHREENVDSEENLFDFLEMLNAVADFYDLPVIVSTHPRTKKMLEALPNLNLDSRVKLMKPFGYCDYILLQLNAVCVISDSGTITEEASILNFPAVMIRNSHERPEGMDAGKLIMAGLKKDRVLNAINVMISHFSREKNSPITLSEYKNYFVSEQILRIVTSYTDYVNKNVWRKSN